jgi:DNA-directed RNA polymerase subunit RPC12/RpoP
MEMTIEYACEQCGAQIMKPASAPLEPNQRSKGANICDDCGHVTDHRRIARLQWSPQLRSVVDRLCSPEERKQLLFDPAKFVPNNLNSKLRAAGKPEVEIDVTSMSVTIREKESGDDLV